MKRKLFAVKTVARLATFAAVAMIIALADEALTNRAAAQSSGPLVGRVQVGGKPVADATVTLYAAGTARRKGWAKTGPAPMARSLWMPARHPSTAYFMSSPKLPRFRC
jgi:hypothetical protein